VTVYAPGADGDVAPVKTISGPATGLGSPAGLFVDKVGRIYVANESPVSVTVYSPAASGNSSPILTISGAATVLDGPRAVTVDKKDRLYVANWNNHTVTTYRKNADGNASPARTIGGLATGLFLPGGIDVDAGGNVYVADEGGAVSVFGPKADGNAAPKVRLAGPKSRLLEGRGLRVDNDNRVTVVDSDFPGVLTFKALVVVKPGKTGKVKVSGKAGANKRTVSWATPEATGGQVKSYQVVVKDGKKTIYKKNLKKKRHSLVLQQSQLGNGKHTAFVRAKNKAGFGPFVSKKFPVRQ
jgi:hypothetical protein